METDATHFDLMSVAASQCFCPFPFVSFFMLCFWALLIVEKKEQTLG